MRFSKEQLKLYAENGFILLPNHFSQAEVELMKAELPGLFEEQSPARIMEKDSRITRSIYGSHMTNELFRRLTRHPRIVEPVRQIIEDDVYIYQFKINAKAAFGGDVWEWHQDYIFWRDEDGMPAPRVINALVFLDEITEFNAPLFLIPGSHREGVIEVGSHRNDDAGADHQAPAWISDLTAEL